MRWRIGKWRRQVNDCKSGKRWGWRERQDWIRPSSHAALSSNLSVWWHHLQNSHHKKRYFSLNPTCILHNWTMPLASAGEAVMISSAQLLSFPPNYLRLWKGRKLAQWVAVGSPILHSLCTKETSDQAGFVSSVTWEIIQLKKKSVSFSQTSHRLSNRGAKFMGSPPLTVRRSIYIFPSLLETWCNYKSL